MNRPPKSLRARLALLLLSGTLVCWLGIAVFSYRDAHHEIDELFDAELAQAALTLLAIAAHGDDEVAEDPGTTVHKYQRRLRFQIWNDDGRLVLRSPNAPVSPLTSRDGFSESAADGGHWRYFSQWDQRRKLQVQVGESHAIRDELIAKIVMRLLLPFLVGLPALALWAWLAIGAGLRPVREVTQQIGERNRAHLQPLRPDEVPEEIRPLVESLNALLKELEQALENERRFTDDAAHELRTPLAAVKAQLQVAMRAANDLERSHALQQLHAGVEGNARLVDQLLALARLDPQRPLEETGSVNLGALAEEVCAELGAMALAWQQSLELDAGTVPPVTGNADMIRMLVRNLVDNAIRYTPRGGEIRVQVAAKGSGAELSVTDSGPGIPAEERERVFGRFYRLAGQEVSGSGLGLSIVKRIAQLHGARVELDAGPDAQGLVVRVAFA